MRSIRTGPRLHGCDFSLWHSLYNRRALVLEHILYMAGTEVPIAVEHLPYMAGAPIVVEQWAKRLAFHPKLRVHVSHGARDEMIPVQCSKWLHDLLEHNGAVSTYMVHPGGHEIGPPDVVRSLVNFVWGSIQPEPA